MPGAASLLDTVGGLLERTYRMRPGLHDLGAFVIGDQGLDRLYAERRPSAVAGTAAAGAKTLVRETADGVHACIYYPDRMIRQLERHPPQYGLDGSNVDAFATFVEEIDHLLVIAEHAQAGRPVTLFEMELHANVSKYLVLIRFLAGRTSRIDPARRAWLRHHLFDNCEYTDPDPAVRARYRDARRWAVQFVDRLVGLSPRERLRVLRGFHGATRQNKLRIIRGLEPPR